MPAVAPLTNTPTHVTDCTTYTQTVTTAITALMYVCTSLLCAFECVCWGAEGSWQRLCEGVGGMVWVCGCEGWECVGVCVRTNVCVARS